MGQQIHCVFIILRRHDSHANPEISVSLNHWEILVKTTTTELPPENPANYDVFWWLLWSLWCGHSEIIFMVVSRALSQGGFRDSGFKRTWWHQVDGKGCLGTGRQQQVLTGSQRNSQSMDLSQTWHQGERSKRHCIECLFLLLEVEEREKRRVK